MPNQKEIKSRIKSVKNTGKITKAMELISTVKMKKAQESVLALRPFALTALRILRHVSHQDNFLGIYSATPANTDKELLVLITSQKGLCGGYNTNIFKRTLRHIHNDPGTPYTHQYDYITIGKRARDFILRTQQNLLMDFSDEISDPLSPAESRRIVRAVIDAWKTGKYTKISIVYNHYESVIKHTPTMKTLFPINTHDILEFLRRVAQTHAVAEGYHGAYTVEPDMATILETALPVIIEGMLHETLLEAKAAEHAARMIAMKNAKDAANKKASLLTLIYNKTRQAAITKEVSEIVSGVESMKDA